MIGYMLNYDAYMYHFVCLVTLLYSLLHSCILGCMYYSCRLDYKYYSFMIDYLCLWICLVGYTLLMHVNVYIWSIMK